MIGRTDGAGGLVGGVFVGGNDLLDESMPYDIGFLESNDGDLIDSLQALDGVSQAAGHTVWEVNLGYIPGNNDF